MITGIDKLANNGSQLQHGVIDAHEILLFEKLKLAAVDHFDHQKENLLLAPDKIVQIADVDARGLGNFAHGRLRVALLYEKLRGFFDDLRLSLEKQSAAFSRRFLLA